MSRLKPVLMQMIFLMLIAVSCITLSAHALEAPQAASSQEQANTPAYLYKVLADTDWEASQGAQVVQLPSADRDFIHFSREDQLDRLLTKYWADAAEFVILKIDTTKLPGNLVFEPNPGSSNKYYHLYNGSIPFDAIIESKVINQELN